LQGFPPSIAANPSKVREGIGQSVKSKHLRMEIENATLWEGSAERGNDGKRKFVKSVFYRSGPMKSSTSSSAPARARSTSEEERREKP